VMMVACVFLALVLSTPLVPGQALAASPFPGGTEVVTGFHATYVFSGERSVHSGVDLSASGGATVLAPVGGTVSFVGSIPSGDGGASATMLGVSLEMPDGRTLTMMPFATTCVAEGDAVSQGDVLGSLAASGDRSASVAHLHVGLKTGRVYEDPTPLLGLGGYAGEGDAEETPVVEDAFAADGTMLPGDALPAAAPAAGSSSEETIPDAALPVEAPLYGTVSSEVAGGVPSAQVASGMGPATVAAPAEPGLEVDGISVVLLGLLAGIPVVAGVVGAMRLVRSAMKGISVPASVRRRSVPQEKVVLEEGDARTDEGRGSAVAGRSLVLVGRG